MEIHLVKRIWSRPVFMKFGKHECPDCGERLVKQKVSKIVDSKSEEAKEYDFSFTDGYMTGNVKFIWTEFACLKCNKHYSMSEICKAEKMKKRASR